MYRVLFIIATLVFSVQVSNAQISIKKLVKEHKKAIKPFKAWDEMEDKAFKANGPMTMGDVTADLFITMSMNALRVETTVMGVSFFQITTDTLEWSYQPIEQKFEFELPEDQGIEESNPFAKQENQFLNSLDEGFKALSVSEVQLDSVAAYKVDTQLNEETRTFYFSPTSFYLLGHEIAGETEYYFNHKEIEGWLWPTAIVSENDGNFEVFRLNNIEIIDEVDPALFEMSEEAKAQYTLFLKEQNEPEPEAAGSFETLYSQAETFYEQGELQKALEKFDEAIAINPSSSDAFNVRGLVKSDLNDEYGAIADFERSLDLEPQNAAPYSNKGLSKYYLGDYDNAIKDFEKAISMDSTRSVFFSNLGLTYMEKSEWQNMFVNFNKAISLDSEEPYYYYYRGLAKAELEDYKGAIDDYDKAAEELSFPDLFNYRGVSYSYLDENEPAAKNFKKAMELTPDNVQYQVNYANSVRGMGQYREAIDIYSRVLEADSTWTSTYYYRGLVYFDLENYDSALMDFNTASSYATDNALFYDYKAYTKEKLGDLKGAIEDFGQSLKLQEDSNIYYRRGLVKLELKDKKSACLDFKSANDLNDENGKKAFEEHCKLE